MRPYYSYFFELKDGGVGYAIFFIQDRVDESQLVRSIQSDLQDSVSPRQLWVFIKSFLQHEAYVSLHHIIAKRLEGASIVGPDSEVVLAVYDSNGVGCPTIPRDVGVSVTDVLDYGLLELSNSAKLIVEAADGFHFEKPSGRHADKFIKASNLMERIEHRYFVALCAIEKGFNVRDHDFVHVDTSGISSFIYSFCGLVGSTGDHALPLVSSFGSYSGLNARDYSFVGAHPVVVVSATTSKGLIQEIRKKIPGVPVKALFYSGSEFGGEDVVFDLRELAKKSRKYADSFAIGSYIEQGCEICRVHGKRVLRLSGDQFIVEHPKTKYVQITKGYSESAFRGFVRDVKGCLAVKMFSDGLGGFDLDSKFFVDIDRLIERAAFLDAAVARAQRSFPAAATHVFYCKDSGAERFARLLVDRIYPRNPPCIGSVDDIQSVNVDEVKGVIVVAAAMETGRSLLNVSRDLRRLGDVPINYFVACAKAKSHEYFEKIKGDLVYSNGRCGRHVFDFVYKIIIPVGGSSRWTDELELFRSLSQRQDLDAAAVSLINSRLDFLIGGDGSGVSGGVFLSSPSGMPLRLQPNFALWDKAESAAVCDEQALVFMTMAAVLQRMRVGKNLMWEDAPLKDDYFVKRIHPLSFDRFNDGIIRAAILRSASSVELDYSSDEAMSELMTDLLIYMIEHVKEPEGDAVVEFFLAVALRSLKLKPSSLQRLIKSAESSDDLDALSKALMLHISSVLLGSVEQDVPV